MSCVDYFYSKFGRRGRFVLRFDNQQQHNFDSQQGSMCQIIFMSVQKIFFKQSFPKPVKQTGSQYLMATNTRILNDRLRFR